MSGQSKNHTLKGDTSLYSLSMGVPPGLTCKNSQEDNAAACSKKMEISQYFEKLTETIIEDILH